MDAPTTKAKSAICFAFCGVSWKSVDNLFNYRKGEKERPERQFQFLFPLCSIIIVSVDSSDSDVDLHLDLDVIDNSDPEYVVETSGSYSDELDTSVSKARLSVLDLSLDLDLQRKQPKSKHD